MTHHDDASSAWLKDEDFVEVTGRIAEATRTGLPLASALRALGEEAPSRRLRQVLSDVSRRLESGESLESALGSHQAAVPPHLAGLLRAGVATGRLSLLLEQYLEQARKGVDLRRQATVSLAYPVLLFLAASAIFSFYLLWVVPEFTPIFEAFDTEVPVLTEMVIAGSHVARNYGLWIVAGAVALGVGIRFGTKLLGGQAFRRRLFCMIPLIGPMFRFSSLARFCHLLALLIEHRVQLPDALGMAANASNDAELKESCDRLIADVDRGRPLEEVAAVLFRRFPAGLWQPFRWANRPKAFSASLRAAGEIFDSRARVQAEVIPVVFEPFIVIGAAFAVGGLFATLLMPLIGMLNALS